MVSDKLVKRHRKQREKIRNIYAGLKKMTASNKLVEIVDSLRIPYKEDYENIDDLETIWR